MIKAIRKTLRPMNTAPWLTAALLWIMSFQNLCAQVPSRWLAEASGQKAYERSVYRGETLALDPVWLSRDKPLDTNGWTFATYWSTNGAVWWSKGLGPDPSLTVTGDPFEWGPEQDCGAAAYTLFIRAAAPGGRVSYRANARLAMLDSPGATPNSLPLPALSIDFLSVQAVNAPWLGLDVWQAASNGVATALLGEAAARAGGDTALSNRVDAAIAAIPPPPVVSVNGRVGDVSISISDLIPVDNTGWHLVSVDSTGAVRGDTVGLQFPDGGVGGAGVPTVGWVEEQMAKQTGGAFVASSSHTPDRAVESRANNENGRIRLETLDDMGARLSGALTDQAYGLIIRRSGDVDIDIDDAPWRAADYAAARLTDIAGATNDIVQTYFLGTNAYLTISNSLLRIEREQGGTNALLWSQSAAQPPGIDPAATQMLWSAVAALQQQVAAMPSGTAWGDWAPDGSPNPEPDYMVYINRPAVMHASGFVWAASGAFSVLASSGAVAFYGQQGGEIRWGPDLENNYVGFVRGGSVVIGATAQKIHYDASTLEVNIWYPYSGGGFPTLWFSPQLGVPFAPMEGVVWAAGEESTGLAVVTAPATTAKGFYYATTSSAVGTLFRVNPAAHLAGGVVGSTNSPAVIFDSVITVQSGGTIYRIPAEAVK